MRRMATGAGPVPAARIRFGPACLFAGEYYLHRVYDDELYPGPRKREVGGRRLQRRLWRTANRRGWTSLASDKLMFQAKCRGLGLPVPELIAVHHPGARTFGSARMLRTRADVARFLWETGAYPIFGKPVGRSMGIGAVLIRGFHGSRVLLFGGPESMELDDFVRGRVLPFSGGFMFQRAIETHPALTSICGPRLTTLRMTCLLGEHGPEVLRAEWKIALGRNVTDNLDDGRAGNLLADVDPDTGVVLRVVEGTRSPEGTCRLPSFPIQDVGRHPETGALLVGCVLPEWRRVLRLVHDAHAALPGLARVGWDVAIGREGPVLLECNHKPILPQLPGAPGVCVDRIVGLVKARSA